MILTADNSTAADLAVQPSPRDKTLTLQEHKPAWIQCLAVGGYPPPIVNVFLDRKDKTSQFKVTNRIELKGEPGLRVMEYSTQLWTNTFLASKDDHGRRLKCKATVSGQQLVSAVLKLDVNCE